MKLPEFGPPPQTVVLNYQEPVATANDLPMLGNHKFDCKVSLDDAHSHKWTGSQWLDIGVLGARGPQGELGPIGHTGATGDTGPTPTNAILNDSDDDQSIAGRLLVLAGGELPSVIRNALHLFTGGHADDGYDGGLTIESYQPLLEFIDRTTGAANFRIYADQGVIYYQVDADSDEGFETVMALTAAGLSEFFGSLQVKGERLTLRGDDTGNDNVCYMEFRQSDGTRTGYFGDASSGSQNLILEAELGSLYLKAAGGTVIDINGVLHVKGNAAAIVEIDGLFHIKGAANGWQTLLIESSVADTDPVIRLLNSDSGNDWTIRLDDSNDQALDFRFNNSSKLTISKDGHVITRGQVRRDGKSTSTAPTLSNSWSVLNNGYFSSNSVGHYLDASYICHLSGVVTGGAVGSVIFTLPSDRRPTRAKAFKTQAGNGSARVDITAAGAVYLSSSDGGWVSLDGISYLVE